MIKAENLTKKFDNYKALDNITCTIPEGCIYGMVGSNGAGIEKGLDWQKPSPSEEVRCEPEAHTASMNKTETAPQV